MSRLAPLLVFVGALSIFGAMFDGYSQLHDPVALLGATGIEHATAFNMIAFVLPGVLAIRIAYRLRTWLPPASPWAARIGAWLALLSAIAFAAQGVWPLDPTDLDAHASRLHYLAWMLWWIAFVPAGLMLAAGLRGVQGCRAFAAASLASAIVVAAGALLPADVLPAGIVQRVGFAAWLSWCCVPPKLDS